MGPEGCALPSSIYDHNKKDCRIALLRHVLAIFERLFSHIAREQAVNIGAMCL
ncbi:hypothetical protein C7450_106454 [Chelatococcus asaccharovorans]|uniref:Uncharacterized protein n=1 Tax=Chelatococcus asaccharovorans TaxID=28210 RepID=A0A2V3U854_9HYPH|nr:hypothetical protein C7450_106454 [Chelatococcus asaccharovorans]